MERLNFTLPMTQSHNHPMTQFLPFSGFYQLADLAFHQVALEGAEMADIELAIQVIGFVQESAGQQFLPCFFEDFSAEILRTYGDFVGASYIFAEIGDAEAAFTLRVLAFGMKDFGVNEDEFGLRVLLEGNVDDGNPAPNADLRSGEADAVRSVHRLKHVIDEPLQLFIENRHRFRGFFENRIAEFHDGINHQ